LLVLLPPSETKRSGGTGEPLDFTELTYPSLNSQRRVLVRALRTLARDPDAMMAALRLGRTQAIEVQRNRALTTSPTMQALDRYTGVLYDALDAPTLPAAAREFAGRHVLVHSALFGPIGALDLVPAYRLSHDSRLPGHPLKKHWGGAVTRVLAGAEGLVLDLRSEAYVALGAAPARSESLLLRVVTEAPGGQKRALNHFNKKSKGEFTRAILRHGQAFRTADELLEWAPSAGFRLHPGGPGELELVVDQVVAAARA